MRQRPAGPIADARHRDQRSEQRVTHLTTPHDATRAGRLDSSGEAHTVTEQTAPRDSLSLSLPSRETRRTAHHTVFHKARRAGADEPDGRALLQAAGDGFAFPLCS